MNYNPLQHKNAGWSGRFSEPMSALTQRYTASIGFDWKLWAHDIQGSLAHAKMLAKVGVLSADDLAAIERGMAQIKTEIEAGTFNFQLELEDIHLNIEKRLTEIVGDAGKRLHTGRSRNDQVALDVRLYSRAALDEWLTLLRATQKSFVALAEAHADTIMPGFTHMQVAMPVTFGHHLLAYVEMLERDAQRMVDARKRVNVLPLGAAALAGTTFPIDREFVAKELGFEAVAQNSLDAVSDRDFVIEVIHVASLMMMHLSRFAEEMVWWMNPRFAFIALPDRFCTGSSIMPQKKNPDVAELIRGKGARVNGHLVAMLTLMKGQPLTYNKDNQEDKEPLFDTVETVVDTLKIMAEMVAGIVPNKENMRRAAAEGFATATDLADYLVRKGMPFREAHEVVARAVRAAEKLGKDLSELPLASLKEFAHEIEQDVFAALTLEGSVAARAHVGGTAPHQVRAQVAAWKTQLAKALG
jgi:argininosuccinate lyase